MVQITLNGEMAMDAVLSGDRKHRYRLSRCWDSSKGMVSFIGLNPSTADETKNDNTITRCINFAKYWGYGGLYMLNLFSLRSTDPRGLKATDTPNRSRNDDWIQDTLKESELVVACWGNHGVYQDRAIEVFKMLDEAMCFGYTKNEMPMHPLRLHHQRPLCYYKTKADHTKAFTYLEKVPDVLAEICRQTIRPIKEGRKKMEVGQILCLHGWEGKPQFSKWNWRRYYPITELLPILLFKDGILLSEPDMGINSMWKTWRELNKLANKDGITDGKTMGEVFNHFYELELYKSGVKNGKLMNIIRW